jgi:hypothetical protein
MAQILSFPTSLRLAPISIKSSARHAVDVRILDSNAPEEARWHLQLAIQNAASFRALKGFTDALARSGGWHSFQIKKAFRVRRFIRQIDRLILEGRVIVKIDGARVQPKTKRAA